ncbi:TIGR01777 family oxidoreductase [Chitinophaga agrisoli]|nr:TIGR01777 family oxidoreductase [Chitinophaga agrisoli]
MKNMVSVEGKQHMKNGGDGEERKVVADVDRDSRSNDRLQGQKTMEDSETRAKNNDHLQDRKIPNTGKHITENNNHLQNRKTMAASERHTRHDDQLSYRKIVIAGGTGFLGQGLIDHFGGDNDIIVLTRHPRQNHGRTRYVYWDGESLHGWESALENADLLINLAGKSVNCRYTERNKQAILDSRIRTTALLGTAVGMLVNPPKVWINAGSATIYRHAQDHPMDEFIGEIADDFSVQVCKQWEQTFEDITLPHTRKLILRIAVTLGPQGGVMPPFLNLLKFGLGGQQGDGRQQFSWVHITDLCRMIAWLYHQPRLDGVFNCSAPHPVDNKTFMQTLRKAGGHRFGLPAPTWLLKLGARLIGTETELLLKSRWVLPTRITMAGFTFQYPYLQPAFEDILRQLPRRQYHLF